jgi:phospholipase C
MEDAMPTVEHVVVLMLENRSFDHMLGLFPGKEIDGLLGPDGRLAPGHANKVTIGGAAKTVTVLAGADYATDPKEIDAQGYGGPSHSFPAATTQLFGVKLAPTSLPDPAPLSGFAQNYYDQLKTDVKLANPTDRQISVPMQLFEHGQLPVLWQLAQEFCVCDRWFSEVPGPTQPNRLFAHCGTSAGFVHNVWSRPFANRTIYEELDKAGRDWAVYAFDLRDSDSFPQIKKRIDRVRRFDSFTAQAHAGTLPAYSFLCPRYGDPKHKDAPPPNSQHAPYDVRNGENLIADVYEALRAGPLWEKTLLIVTYDEHGGFYDHVSPPVKNVSNPDGLTSPTADDQANAGHQPFLVQPQQSFDFKRLGLRVPALLISPWVPRGSVVKTPLQHTSILATLRELFPGVGTLTKRDAEAKSVLPALSLAHPRDDAPSKLNRPPLTPGGDAASLAAPPTLQQAEMAPLLSQLDGHKDSGKVVALPPTRAQAHDYIEERLAAHQAYHQARRRKAEYRIAQAPSGKFSWTFHDEAGAAIAKSGEDYPTLAAAEDHIARLRDLAPYARQIDPR